MLSSRRRAGRRRLADQRSALGAEASVGVERLAAFGAESWGWVHGWLNTSTGVIGIICASFSIRILPST